MSNTKPIYCSSCRFTHTDVQVAHHGHGVRVTLAHTLDPDSALSRFLTEAQTDELTDALVRAGFGSATAEASLQAALRVEELEATIAADGLRMAEMAERLEELETPAPAPETVPSVPTETDPVWDALADLEQRLESDEQEGMIFEHTVSALLNRLETTVFTGQMETRMAVMQERIGRLENDVAILTGEVRALKAALRSI